jgi:hypothetical protein
LARGAPGVLARLLGHRGLGGVVPRTVALPLRLPSAAQALAMMHEEGFGGGRGVDPSRHGPKGGRRRGRGQ